MKFYLEVDVPTTTDAHLDVGRILRTEGDTMVDLGELVPGDKQDVYDADNNRVGAGRSPRSPSNLPAWPTT